MLQRLELHGVGPVDPLEMAFGTRLSVITGDNGLGKSFLLDVAWWSLTRTWANGPALATPGAERTARLGYTIAGKGKDVTDSVAFDPHRQSWIHGPGRPPIPGFIVYARVDGSFAVMDPARNDPPVEVDEGAAAYRRRPTAFFFEPAQVWSGLKVDGVDVCQGLIADWRYWQLEQSREFSALTRALATLSPDPDELLRPGKPRRVGLLDSRDIPTLAMPYGEVPVTHASAGVRRILALTYLLVWAWHEHREASQILGEPPSDRVTLIIDEVEAHLHPRWQRVILTAVLEALTGLGAPVDSQVIAVTHSPLVLASLEDRWDDRSDRLFALDLVARDGAAPVPELQQLPWRPYGDVNSWLTSDIFDLGQARSREAERVLEKARAIMREPGSDAASLSHLTDELARHLPDTDPIFARIDAGRLHEPDMP